MRIVLTTVLNASVEIDNATYSKIGRGFLILVGFTHTDNKEIVELPLTFNVKISQIEEYDKVIIGFPVWWYTAPSIINTFIESVDLSGKTIKAFCTSGGSGIDKCVSDLHDTYPELDFKKGMRFMGDVSKAKEWIENE